ncbi:MAG: TetR/AcrR family transcriptional regulator [Devosia sp.]|nr:TetR/AcrR family transcriptional regulator [Devosia sp.]
MSTSKDEPRYHHGDLRRALVAGGLVLLEEKGASALGLREIARLVGVSAAAPYRHFADRKALLEAVAAEGFRGFAAAMAKAAEGLPEAEQLAAMAFAYVRFALDEPALFRLMFSSDLHPYRDGELREHADAAYATIAVAAAREDKSAPGEMAVTCWSFVHGLAMLVLEEQILGVTAGNADALVRVLTERFVRDIRAGRRETA